VFGKYGFAICVVPYLIYTAGSQSSSYFDSSRAHNAIQVQRGRVGNLVEDAAGRARSGATAEQNRALQDLRLTELLEEIRVPEKLNHGKIERMMQRFLAENSPIDEPSQKVVAEELEYLFQLHEAEEKKLYRDVLEMDYHRQLERDPDSATAQSGQDWFPAGRTYYPTLYTLSVILSTIAVLFAMPGYLRTPFHFSWLSVVVGVVGIVIWIGLWMLQRKLLPGLFAIDVRAAFNPFEELKDNPGWMRTFLGIRFFGLVVIAPIVEEFFLRGWLVRFCDDPDWDEIKLGVVGTWGWVGLIVYALFSHPGEAVASVAWFSLVTWLYIRTGSIWNCVIAHFVTNLLLGLYVVYMGEWLLW
jgi:CAAX prenyl protease-like protein